VVHNTALNSSDNLPSYAIDNHHSSDDVCWMEGRTVQTGYITTLPQLLTHAFSASINEELYALGDISRQTHTPACVNIATVSLANITADAYIAIG